MTWEFLALSFADLIIYAQSILKRTRLIGEKADYIILLTIEVLVQPWTDSKNIAKILCRHYMEP